MNDGDQKYRGSQYLLPLLLGFFPNKFAYWFYKLSCWATPAWILAKLGSHSKGLGGIRKLSIRLQLQNPNAFWLLALEINAFTHSLKVKPATFLTSERRMQLVTAMCLWTADSFIGWFTPTTGRPIPIHEFSCEQQNYRLAVIVWQTLTFLFLIMTHSDSNWKKTSGWERSHSSKWQFPFSSQITFLTILLFVLMLLFSFFSWICHG